MKKASFPIDCKLSPEKSKVLTYRQFLKTPSPIEVIDAGSLISVKLLQPVITHLFIVVKLVFDKSNIVNFGMDVFDTDASGLFAISASGSDARYKSHIRYIGLEYSFSN